MTSEKENGKNVFKYTKNPNLCTQFIVIQKVWYRIKILFMHLKSNVSQFVVDLIWRIETVVFLLLLFFFVSVYQMSKHCARINTERKCEQACTFDWRKTR